MDLLRPIGLPFEFAFGPGVHLFSRLAPGKSAHDALPVPESDCDSDGTLFRTRRLALLLELAPPPYAPPPRLLRLALHLFPLQPIALLPFDAVPLGPDAVLLPPSDREDLLLVPSRILGDAPFGVFARPSVRFPLRLLGRQPREVRFRSWEDGGLNVGVEGRCGERRGGQVLEARDEPHAR